MKIKRFFNFLYKRKFLKLCKKDYILITKMLNKVNINSFKTNDFIKLSIHNKKVELLPIYNIQKQDILNTYNKLSLLEDNLKEVLINFQQEYEKLYRKHNIKEDEEENLESIKETN